MTSKKSQELVKASLKKLQELAKASLKKLQELTPPGSRGLTVQQQKHPYLEPLIVLPHALVESLRVLAVHLDWQQTSRLPAVVPPEDSHPLEVSLLLHPLLALGQMSPSNSSRDLAHTGVLDGHLYI